MNTEARMARALWIVEPGRAELRSESLPEPSADQVLVEARFSALSRGTEGLVFRGGVPPELHASMRCPHQAGELGLPVKYGYCSVGSVRAGAAPLGQRVFCLYPHQDRYVVPVADVVEIPDTVPDRRAVLAANMETAVNGLWDAAPLVGSRVAVIGAGAVGLLAASLVGRIPGVDLEVVDIAADKDELCRGLDHRGAELVWRSRREPEPRRALSQWPLPHPVESGGQRGGEPAPALELPAAHAARVAAARRSGV
jgi:hypothetical protein